ncbi:autotransporter domain-containing protein [Bosea sp. NBC_00550]|uniref:autotransporter domain-containing protein n=1 Tax=Bosea sp. NBC_00550 TaxID=2969621 RepID=UPI003FA4140F
MESLAGRIGARLARSWALDEGTTSSKPRMMTASLKASLWNEFLGSPKTSFSSATGFIPFRSDLGGAWGEIKAGIDAQITRNTVQLTLSGVTSPLDLAICPDLGFQLQGGHQVSIVCNHLVA